MPESGARDSAADAVPTGDDLLQNAAQYRELFQTAPVGIAVVGLSGRLLDVNPEAVRIHGFPREKIVGRPLAEVGLLYEEDVPKLRSAFRRVAAGERIAPLEGRLRHREGGTRWLEATVVRLERESGPWAVQILFQDVTRRKEIELALRASLERYRLLMESAADGILLLRSDGTVTESNASAADILGVGVTDLEGRSLTEMLAPEDLATQALPIDRLRDGETFRQERLLRRPGGRRLVAELVLKMLADGRLMAVIRDVTEQRASARALEQSERRLRAVIHGAPLVLFAVDAEGLFTFSDGRGLEKLGLRTAEVVGRSIFDVYREAPEVCDAARHALTGEPVHQIIGVGSLDWEVRYAPSLDGKGVVTGFTGVAMDITERRRAERALRRSEARYRAIAENNAVGIWQISPEGHTIYANPTMLRMLEIPDLATLAETTFHPYFTSEGLAVIEREQRRREEGSATSYELQLRTAQGRIREVVISGAPVLDARARPQSLIGTIVDVTDRKRAEAERRRLEERVYQAERLESLGILAGGIAHDFNNLLTGVLGNAGLALARLDPSHKATPIVKRIEQTARWAADLTKQLLAYAGRGQILVQPIDLGLVVCEMVEHLASTETGEVKLNLDIGEDLPNVEGDQAQMRQLILNLVKNATEACEGPEGRVEVRVATADVNESWLEGSWLGEPIHMGSYVHLRVEDNGRGMDEETGRRIFEPFFTTKPHGRGLGLAAVLGIIRGLGGAVRLQSRPGDGTTFDILLPIASSRPQEKPMPADAPDHATILIVDDEPAVRDVAGLGLEGAGYEVLEAADGASALALVGERIQTIDLVILDANLDGMESDELLARLRERRADLPVLLISGDNKTDATAKFHSRHLDVPHFLAKPYGGADLEAAVAGILAQPG